MHIKFVKEKAKQMGIPIKKTDTKLNLIRSIQMAEGNTPCYGTNDGSCIYISCLWIDDCNKA